MAIPFKILVENNTKQLERLHSSKANVVQHSMHSRRAKCNRPISALKVMFLLRRLSLNILFWRELIWGLSAVSGGYWTVSHRSTDDAERLPFSGLYPRYIGENRGYFTKDWRRRRNVKSTTILRSHLVSKRPAPASPFGIVYQLPCAAQHCRWIYVGKSGQSMEHRQKEHARAVSDCDVTRSEVAQHALNEGHNVDFSSMKIIDRLQSAETHCEGGLVDLATLCNKTNHWISDFCFF